MAALRYVKQSAYPAIYLFKDLGPHCKDPQVVRLVARPVFLARLRGCGRWS